MDRDWSGQWLRGWALTWPEVMVALCFLVGLVAACVVCSLYSSVDPRQPVEPGRASRAERAIRSEASRHRGAGGPAERGGTGKR